jgi:hypothetical protein
MVFLSDAKVRVTLADGRQIEAANKFGDVIWAKPRCTRPRTSPDPCALS